MKKLSILVAVFMAFVGVQQAKAWGNLAHGTVAYIAEQHLTPEAKEKCHFYLGHTLSFYASWMDQWRGVAKYKSVNEYHSGKGLNDGVNYDMTGGQLPGRVMGHLINALAELGDGKYKNLPDSIVRQRLINMIHYVGDMHCPSHTNFSKEAYPHYNYQLLKKGKVYKYHAFWDSSLELKKRGKWTYEKFAKVLDKVTPEEAEKIQSGSLEEWGLDMVQYCHRAHAITTKDMEVTQMSAEQVDAAVALSNEAVVTGAYRLAYVLNTIFSDKNIPVFTK